MCVKMGSKNHQRGLAYLTSYMVTGYMSSMWC